MTRLTTFLLALSTLLIPSLSFATTQRAARVDRREMAARVRAEFLHAWRGYERYAWGHDELRPLSKTARDWYGEPLYMTQVDALDTLFIMGFREEERRTREFVVKHLSFDRDLYVQNFEITIRHLGGLLSAYQLTGDRRLLRLAEDLGTRLLPAFNSPTGIPYRFVNLRTGKVREEVTNPAEAGTLLVEFGALSKLTGKPVFYDKAKRALVETFKRRSRLDWWAAASTSRPASGWAGRATSAEASTPTTNTCSSAGASSATRTAAGCGSNRLPPSTDTWPTK